MYIDWCSYYFVHSIHMHERGKISGMPINIIPNTTSVLSIKSNYHLFKNINKNRKCRNLKKSRIYGKADVIEPNEVVSDCISGLKIH